MPADPSAAGRKGGAACTPAQNAARRRNGFQKRNPADQQPADLQPGCGCLTTPVLNPAPKVPPILIAQPKAGQ